MSPEKVIVNSSHISATPYSPHTSAYFSAVAVCLLIFLYTLGRFVFFDIIGIRRITQILFLCISVLITYQFFSNHLFDKLKSKQVTLLLVMALFLIYKGDNPVNWLDMLMSVYFVAVVAGAPHALIKAIGKYLVYLSALLSIMAITLLVFLVSDEGVLQLVELPPIFLDSFVVDNPFMMLGTATGEVYEFFNVFIPRVHSFVMEPSLLPAYFGLSLAISLIYTRSIFIPIVIGFFLVASLAASSMSFLALSLAMYILLPRVSSKQLFLLYIATTCGFYFYIFTTVTPIDVSLFTDDTNIHLSMNELKDKIVDYSSDSYSDSRRLSAEIRLSMLSWALYSLFQNFLFGPPIPYPMVYGLFLYSFVNGGILALSICLLWAKGLFSTISDAYGLVTDLRSKMSLSIMAGLLAQAFSFNDYGFSTTYGMVMIALLYKTLLIINEQRHAANGCNAVF